MSVVLAAFALSAASACGTVVEKVEGDAGAGDAGQDATLADFAIAPSRPEASVRAGEIHELGVQVDRLGGFSDPVTVEMRDLPDGVTAASVTIPGSETTGTLQIDAREGTPGGAATATLSATAGDETRLAEVEIEVLGRAGTLDARLGDAGSLALPDGGLTEPLPGDIVGHPGGGFIVVGSAQEDGHGVLYAMKFDADGVLDDGFGSGGVATVSFFASQELSAEELVVAAEQPDGKIVLVGWADGDPTDAVDGDLLVARLTTAGELDPTFAGGGQIVYPVGSDSVFPHDAAAAPDDRVAVVGSMVPEGGQEHMMAIRLEGGRLDDDFGDAGVSRLDNHDFATHVAVEQDGAMVLVGQLRDPAAAGLVRLVEDGIVDATFGAGGAQSLAQQALEDGGFAVLVDEPGIAVAGFELDESTETFAPAFWRLDGGGTLDPDFGVDGVLRLTSPQGGFYDSIGGPEGSVTALGFFGQGDGLLLARIGASPAGLDPDFGLDGVLQLGDVPFGSLSRPPRLSGTERFALALSAGQVARVWR